MEEVDADRFGADRFALAADRRHVCLWLPGGVGRTTAGNDLWERVARTTSTMRSWRTVEALGTL